MITLRDHTHYHRGQLADAQNFNQNILSRFEDLSQSPDKATHYFHGRYENIYIDENRFTELAPLLTTLRQTAARLLKIEPGHLKFGFWFNLMQSGDQTTSHSHDDDDEQLSCVYYLKVPLNSGNLILEPTSQEKLIITPQAGDCIFFDPAMCHEVSQNLSSEPRLSLAGNFGPKD